MTSTEILEKVENFFQSEYEETKSLLERKPYWISSEKEVVFNSIQRCLGVTQFVQCLNVSYEILNIYDEYREKLEKLLDK